jgi:hypothetical protein
MCCLSVLCSLDICSLDVSSVLLVWPYLFIDQNAVQGRHLEQSLL